jgi:hypothetical protein
MHSIGDSVLLVLGPILVLAAYFRAFHHFDRLLELEYQLYRPFWIADGRPLGTSMKEAMVEATARNDWSGFKSYSRLFWRWIFHAPDWIHEDPVARSILWQVRTWLILTLVVLAVALKVI